MEKKAYFVVGKPNPGDDEKKFSSRMKRDLGIVSGIIGNLGYKIENVKEDEILDKIKNDYSGNLMLYYRGHGNGKEFGENNIQEILNVMDYSPAKKDILLDCCGGPEVLDVKMPRKSKLITAINEIGMDASLAMTIWDWVIARKNDFFDLSSESFADMKRNYFRVLRG